MMEIGWKDGRHTLMGTVDAETDTQWFVTVTGCDRRSGQKFIGNKFMVWKKFATILNKREKE